MLENEISIFKKLVSRRKHEVLQNVLVKRVQWHWFSKNTMDQHQQMTLHPKSSHTVETYFTYFLVGSQRRWSLSLLVLTLIFPALLPCLVRDSLCTALQTKRLWINRSLNAIDTIETWVSGNPTALTERSQPAIRWTRGRGGESCVWRLFPWRTLISTFSEPW